MESLIRQLDNWQNATSNEILAWFSEELTTSVSNRLNANDLFKLLGTEVACGLATALDAAGLGLVNLSVASPSGIDFGDDETQRMLATLAVANPAFAPYAATLQGLGKVTKSRWHRTYGDNQALPTVQAITEAVSGMKLLNKCEQAIAIFSSPNRQGKTFAQLKQEVGAL